MDGWVDRWMGGWMGGWIVLSITLCSEVPQNDHTLPPTSSQQVAISWTAADIINTVRMTFQGEGRVREGEIPNLHSTIPRTGGLTRRGREGREGREGKGGKEGRGMEKKREKMVSKNTFCNNMTTLNVTTTIKLTSEVPPGENEQDDTGLLCPRSVCSRWPVDTSHSPTLSSQLHEASRCPLGENWQ